MKGKILIESTMYAFALTSTLWWSYVFLRITFSPYNVFYFKEPSMLLSMSEFGICALASIFIINKIYKNIKRGAQSE